MMDDMINDLAPAITLTSAEKAAIIISALPHDEASPLLEQLGEAHISAFAKATANLKEIPLSVLESVVLEFLDSLEGQNLKLGPDVAKTILSRIMNPDVASDLIVTATGGKRDVWKQLSETDPEIIAGFVAKAHPRAAAIILSRLPSDKAASILDKLDAETAERAVDLLKEPSKPNPHAVAMLGQAIQVDIFDRPEGGKETPDELVGAIFDNLTDRKREPLMKTLEEKDPGFASAVQRQLFLFDDIPARIETKDIPVIVREVDAAVLKTALSYAQSRGSETVDFILSNMSKRLAEQLEEELGEMGKVKASAGGEAESEIVRTVRALAEDATIVMIQEDTDEEDEDE